MRVIPVIPVTPVTPVTSEITVSTASHVIIVIIVTLETLETLESTGILENTEILVMVGHREATVANPNPNRVPDAPGMPRRHPWTLDPEAAIRTTLEEIPETTHHVTPRLPPHDAIGPRGNPLRPTDTLPSRVAARRPPPPADPVPARVALPRRAAAPCPHLPRPAPRNGGRTR